MEKRTEEWFRQSDYDMDTAEYMYQGGRFIYAVFMCHLAIEKALKGLFYERHREVPPKTHNLVFLLNKIDLKPPESPAKFIIKLSEASIPTRYPEDLAKIQQAYTKSVVQDMLVRTREVITWIKSQHWT